MSDANGWSRQEAAVLYRLDELSADLKELSREVVKMREGIAALKVQAGVWGGIAGLVPFCLFMATRLVG
jgi:hypothetical protein